MPGDLDITTAVFTKDGMLLGTADLLTEAWGSQMAANTGWLYWRILPICNILMMDKATDGTWVVGPPGCDFLGGDGTAFDMAGTSAEWYCPHDGFWEVRYGPASGAGWSAYYNPMRPLIAGSYSLLWNVVSTGTQAGQAGNPDAWLNLWAWHHTATPLN